MLSGLVGRCRRSSASVTPVSGELRIATFNLLHGRSMDHLQVEEADLRAAAAAIDADVLGLQEVDRLQDRSSSVDQTAIQSSDRDYALSVKFDPAQVQAWRLITEKHMPPSGGSHIAPS